MSPSHFTSRSKCFFRKSSLTTPAEILNRRLEERKQIQLVGLPGQKVTIYSGQRNMEPQTCFWEACFVNATLWDGFTTIVVVINHVSLMFC